MLPTAWKHLKNAYFGMIPKVTEDKNNANNESTKIM